MVFQLKFPTCVTHSFCHECSHDKDVVDLDECDTFGDIPLPSHRASLEDELTRLHALEHQLELETAVDFQLGKKVLVSRRQEAINKGQRAYKWRTTVAQKVYDYAVEKAQESYTNRCTELQHTMDADFLHELRRLQTAKEGVSVTSRRRRTVPNDTRETCALKGSTNTLRRRPVTSPKNGLEVKEDCAQKVEWQEKKCLEQLLGRPLVFQPVVKQVTTKESEEDLIRIQSAWLCHVKARNRRRRRRIVTPRGVPRVVESTVVLPMSGHFRQKMYPWRRLEVNPHMVQEGQEIQVFRRQPLAGNDDHERVLSGIITAATKTQVYVLTDCGRFESFDLRDCFRGLLYVRRRLDGTICPTRKVQT
ncbi:hypothetical protein CCR75_001628 [Bremia lactucae]|uniref:Uncharacterized protein n=1 Tax=Bremia lactucae TaxID=4779 RepID=A0A976FNL3_BRELC|nr:hypothetical protein CCR75_001628 [Bremia lactucae]